MASSGGHSRISVQPCHLFTGGDPNPDQNRFKSAGGAGKQHRIQQFIKVGQFCKEIMRVSKLK